MSLVIYRVRGARPYYHNIKARLSENLLNLLLLLKEYGAIMLSFHLPEFWKYLTDCFSLRNPKKDTRRLTSIISSIQLTPRPYPLSAPGLLHLCLLGFILSSMVLLGLFHWDTF